MSDQSDLEEELKGPIGLHALSFGSEPLVDLIFVHGLGGGSRKTWCKFGKPENYWPKEWLPRDPEFRRTRVHTFGYQADWNRRSSVLDIHDFARGLISSIQTDPAIRKSNSKLVLVGHSMGGIVIKKAYLLAQQDPAIRQLGDRIHSLYFLATPHRGSELAGTLKSILKFTYGEKTFVNEIERNSTSVEAVNDAFRHYAGNLRLYSFYETEPLAKFGARALIVEKDSAILGLPNEQAVPLSADHRTICKFSSRTDVNYQLLRNALNATIDSITSKGKTENSVLVEP